MEIQKLMVEKLLGLIDQGLCHGAGRNDGKGDFCVQQAVNRATTNDEEHDDSPYCVEECIRHLGISMNDTFRGTSEERARILKRFAVAELGSAGKVSGTQFSIQMTKKWNKLYPDRKINSYENIFDIMSSSTVETVARVAVEVLKDLESPGSKYLYMCEPGAKLLPEHGKALKEEQKRQKEYKDMLTKWKGFGQPQGTQTSCKSQTK